MAVMWFTFWKDPSSYVWGTEQREPGWQQDPVRRPGRGPSERPWQPGPGWGLGVERSGQIWGIICKVAQWPRTFWRWDERDGIANDPPLPAPAEKQTGPGCLPACSAPQSPPGLLWGPPAPRAPCMRASQLALIVVTPQGVMGTHSPCPSAPPLPRQGQALTMPLSQPVAWTQCPVSFIASSRGLLGFLACLAYI